MGRVTQRVDASALDGLAERPPRAALAFTRGEAVEAVPIALHRDGEKIWIGIDRNLPVGDATPLPAVVLIDDGRYWFELRGLTWRGGLVPSAVHPSALSTELRWFEFLIEARVAWDYATLHEERSNATG